MPNTNSSIVGRATHTKGCRPRHPLSIPSQMASRNTLLVAAAMALVAATALLPTTASERFIVGDDAGWNIGVDYKAWARGKKFKVGDALVFKPANKQQDVVLVDEQSFHDCVSTPANHRVPTFRNIVLADSGKFFFICDAEGDCEAGMKLAINVH